MKVPALHHVVGYVVVLVLVGAGSAQALAGTGTVDSGDIKNGQVKRIDLATGAVNGAKVGNDTLTGADIVESTLGKVPNADKVDGLNTGKFTKAFNAAGTTPTTLVASVGGLQVYAGCVEDVSDQADHYAIILVRSTVNDATITRSTTINNVPASAFTSDFDAGEEIDLGGSSGGDAEFIFSTPAGAVVEAHIAWAGLGDIGTNKCFTHGALFGG